jgi:hypothetical protein
MAVARNINTIPSAPRPFWLSVFKYYILTASFSGMVFLLLWAGLNDSPDEGALAIAIIVSGSIFSLAVFFREVVLRNHRRRYHLARALDKRVPHGVPDATRGRRGKLSLEQNKLILRTISERSDAAKVFSKLASAHREVVDLCEEYLSVAAAELPKVRPGSPRLAAIGKGVDRTRKVHHYHLLKWAEIESRGFSREAQEAEGSADKLEKANAAVAVVERALISYPSDTDLLETKRVLDEFVLSLKISGWIEKAERAHFKGNHQHAISLYQDALFDLDRYHPGTFRNRITEKITSEITRLQRLQKGN